MPRAMSYVGVGGSIGPCCTEAPRPDTRADDFPVRWRSAWRGVAASQSAHSHCTGTVQHSNYTKTTYQQRSSPCGYVVFVPGILQRCICNAMESGSHSARPAGRPAATRVCVCVHVGVTSRRGTVGYSSAVHVGAVQWAGHRIVLHRTTPSRDASAVKPLKPPARGSTPPWNKV